MSLFTLTIQDADLGDVRSVEMRGLFEPPISDEPTMAENLGNAIMSMLVEYAERMQQAGGRAEGVVYGANIDGGERQLFEQPDNDRAKKIQAWLDPDTPEL